MAERCVRVVPALLGDDLVDIDELPGAAHLEPEGVVGGQNTAVEHTGGLQRARSNEGSAIGNMARLDQGGVGPELVVGRPPPEAREAELELGRVSGPTAVIPGEVHLQRERPAALVDEGRVAEDHGGLW